MQLSALGCLMAQATRAVRHLNRFFKLQFFVIKQEKMYFVFKLFFLLHHATKISKKRRKICYQKPQAKIESKT